MVTIPSIAGAPEKEDRELTPPTTIAPLDHGVAATGAGAHNEVVHAGDEAAMRGRDTVWVEASGFIPRVHYADVEDPIDYEVGIQALARAEPIGDEVEVPYRSPFE
jgi:hypothetical protein